MTTTTKEIEQTGKSTSKKAKKNNNKKRRISKHILESRGEAQQAERVKDESTTTTITNVGQQSVSSKVNKKRKRNDRCKDPTEVLTYLSTWKAHQENQAVEWKYNKNTQSWLIRHMYDPEKVPKNLFTITVEYLLGMQSESMKQRVIDDATRRALRYKQYEKNQTEGNTDSTKLGDDSNTNNNNSTDETKQQQEQDDAQWMKLDDHEKRKEYKRARKILESFQQE